MKRFFRSAFGKILLYFLITVFTILTAALFVGMVFLAERDAYSVSKTDCVDDARAEWIVDRFLRHNEPLPENLPEEFEYAIQTPENIGLVKPYASEHFDEWENKPGVRTVCNVFCKEGYRFDLGVSCTEMYSFLVRIDLSEPFDELDAFLARLLSFLYDIRYSIYLAALASLLLAVLFFWVLMCVAGKKPGTEEPVPGPFFRVPFELFLAAFCVMAAFASEMRFWIEPDLPHELFFAVLVILALFECFLGLCASFASRVKQKALIRYSLLGLAFRGLRAAFRFLRKAFRAIPHVWKTALFLLVTVIVEFVLCFGTGRMRDSVLPFFLLWKLLVSAPVLWFAYSLTKLQKAGKELAAGHFETPVPVTRMPSDCRAHAESLNGISAGMERAVAERMKSERMKTELITNVSHDIKTPLTSVINYAMLISEEPTENEKIHEYASVLVRQSEKLKRLTEDLVEASKAASGNLEVLPAPCSASTLVTQAAGEYEDRFAAAGLIPVTSLPEEDMTILADSRRMWRVFDNLLGNAVKYSLPGTRVRITLAKEGNEAVFSFRSISREPLNISADELTERFVRGDSSRNTDGNGLGLSIAKSLTELQGGAFDLTVDGDLFKVTLRFPTVTE